MYKFLLALLLIGCGSDLTGGFSRFEETDDPPTDEDVTTGGDVDLPTDPEPGDPEVLGCKLVEDQFCVVICHKGKDLAVNENALRGHLKHGDTEGWCE